MTTYVFSIGRNVDGVPMESEEWWAFQRSLRTLVSVPQSLDVVFHGEGYGVYEGASEQSFTLICSGELGTQKAFEWVTDSLASLAERYRQDSIAFTIGETRFIG